MVDSYIMKSTSSNSSTIKDIELSRTETTRRILRASIIENPNDPSAGVKIAILHQRAASKGNFEDMPIDSLATMHAKEIRKLNLDSTETKALYSELTNLYAIQQKEGVRFGENEIIVGLKEEIIAMDNPEHASFLKEMIAQSDSGEIWKQFVATNPNLVTHLSFMRIYENRSSILDTFQSMLKQDDINERVWQNFFEENTWIFGYGLNYQVLKTVTSQPCYGGQNVTGVGVNKGDFLKSTQGTVKFTVLVEIKTPVTKLLKCNTYRNDVFNPSEDLIGGVSQLRVNANTWTIEGSRTDKNHDELDELGIFTIQPRTILVIGDTAELNIRAKRQSFELFRRGQRDIEILTFDEIFERAKFIVELGRFNVQDVMQDSIEAK